jgi:hypothetical protein
MSVKLKKGDKLRRMISKTAQQIQELNTGIKYLFNKPPHQQSTIGSLIVKYAQSDPIMADFIRTQAKSLPNIAKLVY